MNTSHQQFANNTHGNHHAMHHAAGVHADRWQVNITPVERLARIVIGIVGILGGAILLSGSPSLISGGLETLLILAGLDMVVTGVSGHCPLYKKLGIHLKHSGESHE